MSEALNNLRREIQSRGGPDSYIDQEEEVEVFRIGSSMGLDRAVVDALINQMSRENHWTLERDIIADLNDQLVEATRDDGVIDRKEFEHCVNYAVAMNMPRKRALQLSTRFVLKEDLKVKVGWLDRLLGKNWFKVYREHHGG